MYLVEDLLTKVELRQLEDAAENLLLEWSTEEDLKTAQKNRNLSPLGVQVSQVANIFAFVQYN